MWFGKKKPSHYSQLADKWATRHKEIVTTLWEKHTNALQSFSDKAKTFAVGSLAGILLLATPATSLSSAFPKVTKEKPFTDIDSLSTLLISLHQYLPPEVQALTPQQEEKIGEILSDTFGMQVSATLEGKRLNRSYGYIGQEQHLPRFPGDTMDIHFDNQTEVEKYASYGITPGLGAWGYFAPSLSQMSQEDKMREKYYIAVQTFLAPGYLEHTREMNTFFKYRKMLVVNPENGKAIVADIADAGPSEWTGKQLGGSPEVMQYLERVDGAARGPVLYFFIDDPADKIPLGPVIP